MKKTVLILEDEDLISGVIKNKLEKKEVVAFVATSVQEGLDILSKEAIDVIWLDHYLFGAANGLDFVIKLKSNDKWKNIPIFLVSNTATPDKVSSYLTLGVDKYFTKLDNKLEQIIADVAESIK